jgi:hypothetical protein
MTAAASRRRGRQFDDVAAEHTLGGNEFVDWFNQVDPTYRTDLERINELNFARFDAMVEQRFAESDARLERRLGESELRWEKRFTDLDARLDRRISRFETHLIRWVVALWLATSLGVLALQRL